MKIQFLFLLFFITSILYGQQPNYIFESGFEGTSHVIQYYSNGNPNLNHADIEGADNGYDWVLDLDNDTILGRFKINYEMGDTSKSIAEIVTDPLNSTNKVLKFDIDSPHITYTTSTGDTLQKGRIQAGINNSPDLKEFYFQEKVYFHPDFDSLSNSPLEITWLTIQEFWNNVPSDPFPFRVTLNIQKPSGIGSSLYFGAHGQMLMNSGNWHSKWETIDTTYQVPLGKWLLIETSFIEGDSLTGKFKVRIIDDQNNIHEIVNITNYTHHPNDLNPDGVRSFCPMKLYTSGQLIEGMSLLNANLAIYWDDFKIWVDSSNVTNINYPINFKTKLYPNPNTGLINVDREINSYDEIQIFNSNAELIKSLKPNYKIDLSNLPIGTYYMNLISKDKKNEIFKILKL
jgi:hypothetical protein